MFIKKKSWRASWLPATKLKIFLNNENSLFIKGKEGFLNLKMPLLENDLLWSLKKKKKYYYTFLKILKKKLEGPRLKFKETLEINGIGFKIENISEKIIKFKLGYSHFLFIKIPFYISINLETKKKIVIQSIDEQLLKEFCYQICYLRMPDIYKGKGILFENQKIFLKEIKKK